ncbi:MAG: hypothetical protein ACREL2_06520 [Gemmatimonadales bacterium]
MEHAGARPCRHRACRRRRVDGRGGAIFGGLTGVAFGIGWCSRDNQCNKGTSALIGGAMGAAIGASLGALLDSL